MDDIETKEFTARLDNLPEVEQIKRIMTVAKNRKWEIFYNSEDKKNFHIITDNNIRICRFENKTIFSREVYWSLIKKDKQDRINGGFGYIVSLFLEDYNESHKVIYL